MPRNNYDEDIFKDSTMTFGEHLEELRVCIFRAVLGLALGLAVGLAFGGKVVGFIERPLTNALTQYYQRDSLDRLKEELAASDLSDTAPPYTPEQVTELVKEDGLLAERFLVDPVAVLEQLKALYPDQFKAVVLPPHDVAKPLRANDFMPLFMFRQASDDPRVTPKSFSAHEPFMIYLKASLLVGVVLASPWIFYQIWSFVAAGLYPHERRYVNVYLPFSIALFLIGVAVVFLFVFEPVLNFLFNFNRYLGISPEPRITEWLGFVLMLPLGFGIAFQLPLVMLFLERIGVFTVEAYLAYWRIAILVVFVIAAVLMPPDPWSMLFLAFPLCFLYFGGILLCRLMPKGPGLLPDEED